MPKQPQDHLAPSPWAANAKRRGGFDHVVPSGQTCRIKPIPLEDLVLGGIIDDVDAITKIVDSDIAAKIKPTGRAADAESNADAADGLKFIQSPAGHTAIALMNKIVPLVVVEPTILPEPADGEERIEGAIYVTDIDLADRADIFSVVMAPTEKAAQFRA